MLNTFTSGTTVRTGPSDVRRILMAPTCVCSIISFSPPSTPPGKVWILRRPLVAASSFLPMFSTATTLGYPAGCTSAAFSTMDWAGAAT